MRKKDICFILLVSLLIIFIYNSSSFGGYTDSFKCYDGIVRIKDTKYTKYTVRKKCGEPTSIERLGMYAEVWVYNLGPSQFMRYLNFLGIRLESISIGDYGD